MSFIREWQAKLPTSVGEAIRLAQLEESLDFTYGILATAVLWPVREPVQAHDPEAEQAVKEISNRATAILTAVQTLPGERVAAGRALSAAAMADAELRQGLRELLAHFDATRILQEQLTARVSELPAGTIDQIQAALVNIGGVMTIDTLNLSVPALPEIPPPAEPDRPPVQPNFVGREADLSYFARKLETEHLAVITGMPGVGKTALASALARRTSAAENVFWHAFHEGETIEVLIWELANFLAWKGQDALWRLLQRAQQTAAHPPPATLFNYVIEMVRGRDYLFCLDDFHHVVADRRLGQLVSQLRDLVLAGELQVVISSRIMPDFVEDVHFDPLEGLDHTDSKQLLVQHGLTLDEASLDALHESTGGNATLLILAAQILKGREDPAQLLASLAETTDVERYLLRQVDERITPDEQRVMGAVAVLLDYPGTRDALEAVLDGTNVWRPLQELVQRHLVIVRESEEGRRYSQHDIVRAFYYNSLSRRQRREMHCRAATFYEAEEPDPLRAGLHYYRAGEVARAAAILTKDIWYFVNHGQTTRLRDLLVKLDAEQLEAETRVRVLLVLGRAEFLLDQLDRAQKYLGQALEDLATIGDGQAAASLHAEICLAMAEMLDLQSPSEALEWVEKGLNALDSIDGELAAALRIKQATIQVKLGEFESASAVLESALSSLPPDAENLRCEALIIMSPILYQRGEVDAAIEVTAEALRLSHGLEDHFRTTKVLSDRAAYLFTSGLWNEAINTWQEALALSRQTGNREQELFIEGNLGIAHINVGDYDIARIHLRRSIKLDNVRGPNYASLVNVFAMAKLALLEEKLDEAHSLLEQAGELAEELNADDFLPEIDGTRAELLLLQGDVNAAQAIATDAMAHLEELDMRPEAARVLRTLACIATVQGRSDDALRAFGESYAGLERSDPYEAALTEVWWARLLQSLGSQEEAGRHFEAARKTFARLGARRALADLTNVITADTDTEI